MKTILLGLALLMAAPSLAAQPASDDAQADPAAVAAAEAMLEAMDFEAQMERTARLASQTAFSTMIETLERQNGRDFPPELERRLREILAEHTEAVLADMRRTARFESARIYARYFTAEEIGELSVLLTNPVMVKMQTLMPQLLTELSQIGVRAEAERMIALEHRVADAVRHWYEENERFGSAPRT